MVLPTKKLSLDSSTPLHHHQSHLNATFDMQNHLNATFDKQQPKLNATFDKRQVWQQALFIFQEESNKLIASTFDAAATQAYLGWQQWPEFLTLPHAKFLQVCRKIEK